MSLVATASVEAIPSAMNGVPAAVGSSATTLRAEAYSIVGSTSSRQLYVRAVCDVRPMIEFVQRKWMHSSSTAVTNSAKANQTYDSKSDDASELQSPEAME